MSPAALPEVCDYYVTRTKGCCWQKLPEPKPWDYLLVSRTALLKQPEGSQSVLSSCFQISSLFLFLFFFFLFIIWLWLSALKYLIYETALKHLFPLGCWKDSRNMGCIFTLESKSSSQACPALSLKLKWQVRGLNEGICCWDYIAWSPEWQEGSSLYLGSIWVTVTLQHHQKNPRQNNHPM